MYHHPLESESNLPWMVKIISPHGNHPAPYSHTTKFLSPAYSIALPIISAHSSSAPSFVCSMTMEVPAETAERSFYSVWAVPPEDLAARLKKLMDGLRSDFGGPQFQPHVTVVGAISLTEHDALEKFRSACDGLKAYNATVDRVAAGTFFYQCVYLLLHPTAEVVQASEHCRGHFGYESSTPYMPHLSLLYGDLTDDEKKNAQEKANVLDENINDLNFQISRVELWKTDTEDKTLQSWVKVAESNLSPY